MLLFPLFKAVRAGRRVVGTRRRPGAGDLQQALNTLARSARPRARRLDTDLRWLRLCWRLSGGAARPVRDEALFLTAALLTLGHDAAVVVGRRTAPTAAADYLYWVTVDGVVVSTGIPVEELYTPVASLPQAQPVSETSTTGV